MPSRSTNCGNLTDILQTATKHVVFFCHYRHYPRVMSFPLAYSKNKHEVILRSIEQLHNHMLSSHMVSDVCKSKDVCIHFQDSILQISPTFHQKNERLLKHGYVSKIYTYARIHMIKDDIGITRQRKPLELLCIQVCVF